MKKTSFFLAVVMILQLLMAVPTFAAEVNWPTDFGIQGRHMPFRPEDKYVCEQNPPDFSWPAIQGAISYDLIVCRDSELTDIAYEKRALTDNFYNFDKVFEKGTYYWAVSFRTNTGKSKWTEARRFRIAPDASEFPVVSLDEMMARVPKGHPRIYTTAETLDSFRAPLKTKEGKAFVEKTKAELIELMKLPIGEEPKAENYANSNDLFYKLFSDYWPNRFGNPMYNSGLIYLLTGDKEIGRYGVDLLMAVSSWDQNGPTSYVNQDQVHRDIAYKAAFAYDWLYDLMTEEERATALKMIKERTQTMATHLIDASVSIKERPYESHGWTAFTFIITISLATCHDLPEAKNWLEFTLPTYINVLPPWSNEDGGWSQGTYYYLASNERTITFEKMLANLGIIDISQKAWLKNEPEFPLYFAPYGSAHTFGDNAYTMVKASNLNKVYANHAIRYNSGVAVWAMEEFGPRPEVSTDYIDILYGLNNIEPEMPLTYKKAKRLKDVGWTAMHSDLVDQDRISLYFKSSPFGSFNHSHADQNTFVLRAYGERLAIDSGYYDYGTNWENKYVRQTFAHNGITINGGKGQTINDINAKGEIKEFITHPDFDMVKGDAVNAYPGTLKKADRYILYVRPDTFIVVDDLEASAASGASYEFWLNGMKDSIKVYEDGTGAKLQQGAAVLDARVQYPEKVQYKYSNIFSGADLVKVETEKYKTSPVQQRIWFATEELPKTKLVTTLDVHHSGDNAQLISRVQHKDYLELGFENGAKVYINTSDAPVVDAGDVKFTGVAALVNDSSVMLVSGTYLENETGTLLNADKPISAVFGRDLIGLSASDDVSVSITGDLSDITDEEGRALNENIGVRNLTGDSNTLTMTLDKGDYNFCINGSNSHPEAIIREVSVTVDGVTTIMNCQGNTDASGKIAVHGKLGNSNGMYRIVSLPKGTTVGDSKAGDIAYLEENMNFTCYDGENLTIVIEKADFPDYEITEFNNPDSEKANCTVFMEAESFISKTGDTSAYDTRAFLSGGVGVSNMNTPTDSVTYEFEVAEAGNYRMVIKNVAWVAGTQRQFVLDSSTGMFACPLAESYGTAPEQWKGLKVEHDFYLEKGKHTLVLRGLNNYWNIDWIGFVKN